MTEDEFTDEQGVETLSAMLAYMLLAAGSDAEFTFPPPEVLLGELSDKGLAFDEHPDGSATIRVVGAEEAEEIRRRAEAVP